MLVRHVDEFSSISGFSGHGTACPVRPPVWLHSSNPSASSHLIESPAVPSEMSPYMCVYGLSQYFFWFSRVCCCSRFSIQIHLYLAWYLCPHPSVATLSLFLSHGRRQRSSGAGGMVGRKTNAAAGYGPVVCCSGRWRGSAGRQRRCHDNAMVLRAVVPTAWSRWRYGNHR